MGIQSVLCLNTPLEFCEIGFYYFILHVAAPFILHELLIMEILFSSALIRHVPDMLLNHLVWFCDKSVSFRL